MFYVKATSVVDSPTGLQRGHSLLVCGHVQNRESFFATNTQKKYLFNAWWLTQQIPHEHIHLPTSKNTKLTIMQS